MVVRTVCSEGMDHIKIENQHEESNDGRNDTKLRLAKMTPRYMGRRVLGCCAKGRGKSSQDASERESSPSPSPQMTSMTDDMRLYRVVVIRRGAAGQLVRQFPCQSLDLLTLTIYGAFRMYQSPRTHSSFHVS